MPMRSRSAAASTLAIVPLWDARTAACDAELQQQIRRRRRSRRYSRAPPAVRRGSRRHGDHRHRADRHAVRALQGRHQPQSGGGGRRHRRRRRRARSAALHRAISSRRTRDDCRYGSDPRLARGASRRRRSVSRRARPAAVRQSARRLRAARGQSGGVARSDGPWRRAAPRARRRCARARHGVVHEPDRARDLRQRPRARRSR